MTDGLLREALDIVSTAGKVAALRYREGSTWTLKPDGSQVTEADVEVERLVRGLIAERFPGDGVYGEEEGETVATTGRRWVIDPINGTTVFVQRIPIFNMLLSIEEAGEPVVSVVAYPMNDEVVYATRGGGTWRRFGDGAPERLTVSARTGLHGAVVGAANMCTWSEELLVALHRKVWLMSHVGATELCAGRATGYVIAGYPMGYEDVATLPLLIGEAGGRVTDLAGNDVLTGSGQVLATNGHVHDEMLDLLRGLSYGMREMPPDA